MVPMMVVRTALSAEIQRGPCWRLPTFVRCLPRAHNLRHLSGPPAAADGSREDDRIDVEMRSDDEDEPDERHAPMDGVEMEFPDLLQGPPPPQSKCPSFSSPT